MIEVHLYGKLRRFTENQDASSASIAVVAWQANDTVQTIVDRLGIPQNELGSNKFLNGRYATLESSVQDGDRLGLFPDDMQLLYKWYFAPSNSSSGASSQVSGALNQDSAEPARSKEPEK